MAIKAILETSYGETRELYVRINNIEASNHSMPATALARGFLSEAAFETGKSFVWEKGIEFAVDVAQPLWAQAYAALRAEPDMTDAVNC